MDRQADDEIAAHPREHDLTDRRQLLLTAGREYDEEQIVNTLTDLLLNGLAGQSRK